MISMRRVPDNFDNVQALHSPYGDVQGLSTPLSSPSGFNPSTYADAMLRPLMVDVHRQGGDDSAPPTGLSPALGSIGFHQLASVGTSDLLPPASRSSNDRYGYQSQLSSPLSAVSRGSHSFTRQDSLDTLSQMTGPHRGMCPSQPVQPFHLRETLSTALSDLESPLRPSMSWKGNSIDYSNYPGQSPGRQNPVYQVEGHNAPSADAGGYGPGAYLGKTSAGEAER